jgi:hypothetical protein
VVRLSAAGSSPHARRNHGGSVEQNATGSGGGGGDKNANSGGNTNANDNASNDNKNADGKKEDKKEAKADGGDSGADKPCGEVSLGPAETDDDAVAKKLDKAAGVDVKVIGARKLLLCGTPQGLDIVRAAARELTGALPERQIHETHYARLFYFRHAGEVAGVINGSGGLSTPVKALGDDLLMFTSESDADDQAIHELKRWVSTIDVPRPEISLLAWSAQVTSGKPDDINLASARIRSAVSGFNDRLQSAIEQGWWFLEQSRKRNPDNFFAPNLNDYLSKKYVWSPPGTTPMRAASNCGESQYCLGYTRIFKPIQPSLSSMLLALIAAQPNRSLDNARALRDDFVNCMEHRQTCQEPKPALQQEGMNGLNIDGQQSVVRRPMRPQGVNKVVSPRKLERQQDTRTQTIEQIEQAASDLYDFDLKTPPPTAAEENTCESNDLKLMQYEQEQNEQHQDQQGQGFRPSPGFSCFREQLHRSMDTGHLGELRRDLADFLFQYKSAEYYPRDFVAWNQVASAQALDTNLDPLIVAFNRDLSVYLRHIQDQLQAEIGKDKKAKFASDGIITALVVSGNKAKVDTTTQSFFPTPPTLSARDLVSALGNTATPKLAPIMTGHAADLIAAAMQAEQRTIARVGRDFNIQITANTLKGASACEMDVELNSGETDKPSLINTTTPGTPSDENLSRVAKHNVNTMVRVDSQKLFEVSSFAAALVHGRSVPLVPPFVDLPYIGNLARLRLSPSTVYHRSFAIVSAVIVPTAADLANMIEFSEDLEQVPSALKKAQRLEAKITTPQPPKNDEKTPKKRKPTRRARRHGRHQASPTEEAEHAVYYWVVTHFREGDSESEPLLVKKAPVYDDAHTVTLRWQPPANALSFDVLWAECPEGSKPEQCMPDTLQRYLVAENIVATSITDDKKKPTVYTSTPRVRTAFARITKPAGNLRSFHKAMLDCIELEAENNVSVPCEDADLLKLPVEGRNQ